MSQNLYEDCPSLFDINWNQIQTIFEIVFSKVEKVQGKNAFIEIQRIDTTAKVIYFFKCYIGKRLKDNKGDLEKIYDEHNLSHLNEKLVDDQYWTSRVYNEIMDLHKIDISLTYLEEDLQMLVKKYRLSSNQNSKNSTNLKIPYIGHVLNQNNNS